MDKSQNDKYKPFFLRHKDLKNCFYDSDFEEIRKTIKHLDDILKAMTLRFERHDTLAIARSVFDYVTQKEMYLHYPHMYYDFRFGDTRICIGKKHFKGKNLYFVNVCGFHPQSHQVLSHVHELGFFASENITDVLEGFSEVVREFILTQLGSLF